ncbi:MAG: hypothetical protein KZQ71_08625 [Candidatus Thiodiazotropha sp. (ex Lucinoma aequizonata)]|nr:hypothetical protein [Candidatus Thiodiazotropha sp. (ex Lucinoma aequizonata)]
MIACNLLDATHFGNNGSGNTQTCHNFLVVISFGDKQIRGGIVLLNDRQRLDCLKVWRQLNEIGEYKIIHFPSHQFIGYDVWKIKMLDIIP